MGSKTFDTTSQGYASAYAEIQRIKSSGGRADGDTGKVLAYFGK